MIKAEDVRARICELDKLGNEIMALTRWQGTAEAFWYAFSDYQARQVTSSLVTLETLREAAARGDPLPFGETGVSLSKGEEWTRVSTHVPPESWDVWTWGPYSGVTLATYTGGQFIDAHGRDDGEGLNIVEIPDAECWMVVEEPEPPM